MSSPPVYARCPLAVVSVRARADHRAELVTQLLFGERVEIRHTTGKGWSKVRCEDGRCAGWVRRSQLLAVTETDPTDFAYSIGLLQPALGAAAALHLPFGACLPQYDGLRFRLGEASYQFNGQTVATDLLDPYPELVIKLAMRFLHAPYLPGGRTLFGIDGAGLFPLIFRLVGIALPRRLVDQVRTGIDVGFPQQALPGDLIFYGTADGALCKVALLLPDDRVLHVDDRVRVGNFDHRQLADGVDEGSNYRLRTIRRVLPQLPAYRRGNGPRRGRGGKQFELF